jgi:hypothetical protein
MNDEAQRNPQERPKIESDMQRQIVEHMKPEKMTRWATKIQTKQRLDAKSCNGNKI